MNTTAITVALALCDKPAHRELPEPITRVQAIQARFAEYGHGLPEVADLGAQLVAADPGDFDVVLDAAALEYARRVFIAETNRNGWRGRWLRDATAEAMAAALPEIHSRLAPVFDKAAKDLTAAAKTLPAGPAALDPAAVLEADAGSAYHAAREAARRIVVIGNAFPIELAVDGSTPHGTEVGRVATFPTTEVTRMHAFAEKVLNDEAAQETARNVRDVVKSYAADPNLTVLEISRGTFGPDINLDLAGPDELARRVENIARAHMTRRERETA